MQEQQSDSVGEGKLREGARAREARTLSGCCQDGVGIYRWQILRYLCGWRLTKPGAALSVHDGASAGVSMGLQAFDQLQSLMGA